MDDFRKRLIGEQLTHRELEIVRLVADGQSNQAIAEQLFITLGTVKWYLKQIYSKIGVSSRTQAIAVAHATGLLDGLGMPVKIERSAAPRHNLPYQTTEFVGREEELLELATLLTTTRLVTILGLGGIGKTRLALETAVSQLGAFPQGVYFVSLAPLTAPESIILAIAEAVRFSFYGDLEPKQQLCDFLRTKHLLLVLDNFEHLFEGVALVNEILQVAPSVKVLATSREQLNIEGETLFRLEGMDFPDWETPEDAAEYSAVKLFLQSARRVEPTFALDTDNLKYIARICRLVQGMPLGILLAASWVEALTLSEIAKEIENSLNFLESDRRDLPARQRSLRATFDYSWNLLSGAEREAFKKLSVFRGGFTREAAQQVSGASLATLKTLVNKSLLRRNAATGRYDLHELLRQFGEEQLNSDPREYEHIRELHCECYTDYMQRQWKAIMSLRQGAVLDEIGVEFNNIRVAWDYAIETRNADVMKRMAMSMLYFTDLRSIPNARNFFSRAADALQTRHPDASIEIVVGLMWAMQGYVSDIAEQSIETIEKSLLILANHVCPEGLVIALLGRSVRNGYNLLQFDVGFAAAQEALLVARKNHIDWAVGKSLFMMGYCLWLQGHLEEAKQAGTDGLMVSESIGDVYHMAANATYVLGPVAKDLRDYVEAERQLVQGLRWFQELDVGWHVALTSMFLSQVALLTRDYEKANGWIQRTVGYFRNTGKRERMYYEALCEVSRVLMALGKLLYTVELLSAIKQQMPMRHFSNAASYHYVDDMATTLLGDLESVFPAETYAAAEERGRARDLDTIVSEFMAEPPL